MDLCIVKFFYLSFLFFTDVRSQQFFNTMPPPVNTNFTCKGRDTGFYADMETNCRVYHTCDENGNKFTYYCPAETAFRQEALVCDHAHLVDCANGRRVARIGGTPKNEEATKGRSFDHKNGGGRSSASLPEKSHSEHDEKMSSSAYTRTFKITQDSQSRFSTPFDKRQPTFVLSSSVFLRDRGNSKKDGPFSRDDRLPIVDNARNTNYAAQPPDDTTSEQNGDGYTRFYSSTTSSFGINFPVKQHTRNNLVTFRPTVAPEGEKTADFSNTFATTRRPYIFGNENHRLAATTGEPRNYQKFKLTYPNESESRAAFDEGKKSKPMETFELEHEPMKDARVEMTDRFLDRPTNSEKELENQARDRDGAAVSVENSPKVATYSKDRNGFNKSPKEPKISPTDLPFFPYDSGNFPYSETLRSMQEMSRISSRTNSSSDRSSDAHVTSFPTTVAPPVTAGTEFPVPALVDDLSSLEPNELEDDPYYPKRSTTTEAYYKLSSIQDEKKKSLRFSTKRPWTGSLNFEIPEVLPDLNTLDDLVDRRKYFYIPRVTKNTLRN